MFDTSSIKRDKSILKEFAEIKNRMCRYNVNISMRRSEYRLSRPQNVYQNKSRNLYNSKAALNIHELLTFTLIINSYSFTDTPNIIIPIFREEEE